jgi:hypothetical protein
LGLVCLNFRYDALFDIVKIVSFHSWQILTATPLCFTLKA